MKIETKDSAGHPNGWLIPLWNATEQPGLRPDQVYATALSPHARKGPHLHMERQGQFYVITGEIRVRLRNSGGGYWTQVLRPGDAPLVVPAGTPCALYECNGEEAIVINMPSPAWTADNPDDWPVEDWLDEDPISEVKAHGR